MIDLLLEKDECGMAELMRQYAPLLKYIIAPIVADAHEREDCLSEISLIIWDKIGLFDPEKGSLRAYLTAIARNAAVSHAKRLGSCALFHVRSRPSPPNRQVLRAEPRRAARWSRGTCSCLSSRP